MICFLLLLHQVFASGLIREYVKDPDGVTFFESEISADMDAELNAKKFPRQKRGLCLKSLSQLSMTIHKVV